jgi:hypothetical protein
VRMNASELLRMQGDRRLEFCERQSAFLSKLTNSVLWPATQRASQPLEPHKTFYRDAGRSTAAGGYRA